MTLEDMLLELYAVGHRDFRQSYFGRLDLRGQALTHIDLSHSDLRGSDLRNVDLTGANLTDTNLTQVDLRGANLTCANLTRANLSGADLSQSYCNQTNFTDAIFRGACFDRTPPLSSELAAVSDRTRQEVALN